MEAYFEWVDKKKMAQTNSDQTSGDVICSLRTRSLP